MKKKILFITLLLFLTLLLAATQPINAQRTPQRNHPLQRLLPMLTQYLPALKYLQQPTLHPQTPTNPTDDYQFIPQDITLKDDAYHSSDSLHFTEWWYFDATFENGYSAQLSVRVLSALKPGLVFTRLDIYKDGLLLEHNQDTYLLMDFSASTEKPSVQICGESVIEGTIDEKTGQFVFSLDFEYKESSAHLVFTGVTEGWKGQLHGGDWWSVVLPKATVAGTIHVHEQTIPVTGIGYHDHNWDVSAFASVNYGWFWGKLNSDRYTITWSNILTTRVTEIPIMVINMDNGGYLNIPVDTINFHTQNYRITNSMLIPYEFSIRSSSKQATLDISMRVINTHHERMMGFANYWRYHVRCTGLLSFGSYSEYIDNVQIIEFIKFRR